MKLLLISFLSAQAVIIRCDGIRCAESCLYHLVYSGNDVIVYCRFWRACAQREELTPPKRRFQSPTPPPLPFPCHDCQIPVAAVPLLPPKSLLTRPSDIFQIPPNATTSPGSSLLPRNQYPSHIPQK